MKLLVVYYSMYGHIFEMAKSVMAGAKSVEGVEVELRRVPETLPQEVLEKMGAIEAQKPQRDVQIATVEELGEADGVIFGTPTRFGIMCGQMKQFLDATGSLWMKGALIGKPGSVFASSATQHGGQESTIINFHTLLLHQGMVVVGLPYSFDGQNDTSRIIGCSPYGASTVAGADGSLKPTEIDLAGAFYQGAHVANIAKKLAA